MKLQHRSLMLPAIAGIAFTFSLVASLYLGMGLEVSVQRIAVVLEPMERLLLAVDRAAERAELLRLGQQGEAAGKELETARQALQAIAKTPGQGESAGRLGQLLEAFAAAKGTASSVAYAPLRTAVADLTHVNEQALQEIKADITARTPRLVMAGLLGGA